MSRPTDYSGPDLPDVISDDTPDATDDTPFRRAFATSSLPTATHVARPWRFRALKHGCYLTRFTPRSSTHFSLYHYDGTIRVERSERTTRASGDLYIHNPFIVRPHLIRSTVSFAGGVSAAATATATATASVAARATLARTPSLHVSEPNPAAGIPIFARAKYRYYLRITKILQWLTLGSSFDLEFEMWRYNRATKTWSNEKTVTANMSWTTAPSGYPSASDYLEGDVKDNSGSVIGRLSMGWVSTYLRKATIEMDRVSASELPSDNGAGLDWRDVFDAVGWDVTAYESDTNLTQPSGSNWSDAELHQAMVDKRDQSNHDAEWRYHLLCVRGLDSTSRGIMYDASGTDSNNLPREGAAIASHWVIPNETKWGTVQGVRFGLAAAPYFRTAVHELGHAMGLRHNTADNGFMNTTGVIAGNTGTFPANILWAFNAEDARKLRHMPDAWVRPGEIPWAPSYGAPISADENVVDAVGLALHVEPLLSSVPIGAPVRVRLALENLTTDHYALIPDSLSLRSEHVTGRVQTPGGDIRTFRSIVRCIEDDELAVLKAGDTKKHDLTLLRGPEGALFDAPGVYTINVDVKWEVDGLTVLTSGNTSVMVTPPVDDAHADAAVAVLSEPDTLLVLALGGDHLTDGQAGVQAALENDVLRPHFAVVEFKKLAKGRDKTKAFGVIDGSTVLSGSEMWHVAEALQQTKPATRSRGKAGSAKKALVSKIKTVAVDDEVSKLIKKL